MTSPRQGGMTLLEVMVALFLFAVAVGGLLKAMGESARHAERLENRYFAQQVAQNRLVTLQLQPRWPAIGVRTGTADLGGRHYRWQQRVETTPDTRIRRVTVRVGSTDRDTLVERAAFMGETP